MESFAPLPDAGRIRAISRGRLWPVDLLLALTIGVLGVIGRPAAGTAAGYVAAYGVIVAGCCVALVFRRLRPRLSLTVIATLLVAYLVTMQQPGVFVLAVCAVAAYTTQTRLKAPGRWVFAGGIYAGSAAAAALSPIPPAVGELQGRVLAVLAAMVLLTAATLTGVVRRYRHARYRHALERADSLERQQGVERRLAAVEERTRIVREMHDVLGHSLSAIAMQAEGVRYVARADSDRADQVLADIGHLSRKAVDDVRDLIAVLSTDAQEAALHPSPSLNDLPELIGSLRYTKAPIRLHVDGELDSVPGHVGLAGYRIIQEALTNALKHADGAPITVHVAVSERVVRLSVLNIALWEPRQGEPSLTGNGLIGMQERARAIGGKFEAGLDSTTGGWRVAARLPWSTT